MERRGFLSMIGLGLGALMPAPEVQDDGGWSDDVPTTPGAYLKNQRVFADTTHASRCEIVHVPGLGLRAVTSCGLKALDDPWLRFFRWLRIATP